MPLNTINAFLFKNKKKKGYAIDSLLSMGNNSDNNYDKSDNNSVINGLNELKSGSNSISSESSSRRMSNTLTTISGIHSHRNVKPQHQMLLAENLFEENIDLNIKCRFNQTIQQIVKDNNIFPYFVQYMESIGSNAKNLIRFWIQTECLSVSQKNVDSNVQKCDDKQNDNKLKIDDFRKQFIDDSIGIFDKFLSQSSVNVIEIPEEIRTEIEVKISNKTNINCDLFSRVQSYVLSKIEDQYYQQFMRSTYYCKYEVEILTNGSVRLPDILFNNSRLATNFIEFMEIEGMKPYVDFLIMFENYKKVSNDYEDAIAIFNRFFSFENTTNGLGFSDSLRHNISEKLSKNNGFSSDCFDRVAALLIQYFEKTYLRQFLESELYFEYLTHCIQSIQIDMNYNKKFQIHKRTNSGSSYNSDCSFVSSIGTRDGDNGSTSSPVKYKIKSSHLNEEQKPDSIWKRDLSGKLQFTHIDKYGRISSCLEPEPDRLSSGTLTKVMKKFSLHSSDDKDKEEIAWKIARMIVNDVCNTTQDLSHSST